MTAKAWVGLVKLLVMTWQMLGSLPVRAQPPGVPVVWSRLAPSSNLGLGQKLLVKSAVGGGAVAARATERSSRSMTPIVVCGPPDTRAARIFAAPEGTTNTSLRLVNPEPSIAPCHPALWPVLVLKSVDWM